MHKTSPRTTALTIGTADSSGLGGVQSDLRTFAAFGVYGISVVTAVAARNTRELAAVAEVPDEVVIAQLDAVLEDIGADAVKVGALWSRSIAENAADRLEAWGSRHVVLSPSSALIAQAGRLDHGLLTTLRRDVLSHASVLTLDVAEASLLSGSAIEDEKSAMQVCRILRGEGRCAIHLSGTMGTGVGNDLLLDGDDVVALATTPRASIEDADVFSAALTALLARGLELQPAMTRALSYCAGSIVDGVPDGANVVAPGNRMALEIEPRTTSDEP